MLELPGLIDLCSTSLCVKGSISSFNQSSRTIIVSPRLDMNFSRLFHWKRTKCIACWWIAALHQPCPWQFSYLLHFSRQHNSHWCEADDTKELKLSIQKSADLTANNVVVRPWWAMVIIMSDNLCAKFDVFAHLHVAIQSCCHSWGRSSFWVRPVFLSDRLMAHMNPTEGRGIIRAQDKQVVCL